MPFLVPGIGAQGGSVEQVLRHGPVASNGSGRTGGGLLVNVSRGIASAALDEGADRPPGELVNRLARAAQTWAAKLPVLP